MNYLKVKRYSRTGSVLLVSSLIALLSTFDLSAQGMGQQYLMKDWSIAPDQYVEDFNSIHTQVKDNYSLYKQKGIDMDSLYSCYSTKLSAVKCGDDYGEMLLGYFADLQVGHAFMLVQSHTANYLPQLIEDHLWIDSPNTLLSEAGFEAKDEILAIDGLPVLTWLEQTAKVSAGSTPQAKRQNALSMVFSSYTDSLRKFQVRRGDKTLELTVPLSTIQGKVMESFDDPVSVSLLNDSVGYIEVKTMQNDVVTPFAEKLKEVENLPYLIVDIRRNEGGNSNNGIGLCELLLKKPLLHCLDERIINPQPEAYKGKVYLLIGPRTFSAAESFAIDMMESGEVILVGEPTAGDSGNNPRPFVSKYGIPFIIPTREPQTSRSGFPMEGLGVPPQILIKQTTEDFLMGIDTQLSLTL